MQFYVCFMLIVIETSFHQASILGALTSFRYLITIAVLFDILSTLARMDVAYKFPQNCIGSGLCGTMSYLLFCNVFIHIAHIVFNQNKTQPVNVCRQVRDPETL